MAAVDQIDITPSCSYGAVASISCVNQKDCFVEIERFDRLARAFITTPSRRALLTLLGSGLAVAKTAETAAKKKCGPCKKKKKGKCKKKKPNDTPCNGEGRCLNGVCNQPPTCSPALNLCIVDGDCCSGDCVGVAFPGDCAPGEAGTPCFNDSDCTSGVCTGFRCQ
jgi:hypothetical protein